MPFTVKRSLMRWNAGLIPKYGEEGTLGQYFAALTNMRSVGVMGDFRTYDYAVALRAVLTSDFMTAEAAQLPWEVLQTRSPPGSSTK